MEYDKGDFIAYPQRVGWTREELFIRDTWTGLDGPEGRSSEQAASFLQEWLFFGLLHAFFGDFIRFSDFIDADQNGFPVVHTRKLIEISKDFAKKEHLDRALVQRDFQALDSCLMEASAIYDFIRQNPGTRLDPYFLLSLATLGSFLCSLRQMLQVDPNPESVLNQIMWQPPSVPAEEEGLQFFRDQNGLVSLLTREMVRSGWCPRAVFAMTDFFGLETQMFYSHLRIIDVSEQKHSKCTNLQCLSCQINKAEYESIHSEAGCECEFLAVDPSSLLRQGYIPLVSLANRHNSLPALELVEYTAATPFVAISHVWSDGLGNPFANSMPVCQLREIKRLVQNLYPEKAEPVHFWIDTLCVPSSPGDAKKEAIKRMRETYALADKVLVLDATLRRIPVSNRSILEQALWIYSSNWMSRLWTLQEGALSQSLWVRSADLTLECARIKEEAAGFHLSLRKGWGNSLDIQLIYGRICGSEKVSIYASGKKTFDISGVCTSLSRRCTSVTEDEALCIGSLLALDMDPIAGANPVDRMRAFWSRIQTVPESLMFWRYGTLQDVGFRWAPKTFLGTGSPWLDAGSVRGRPQAIPTPAGLFVNAYAIEIEDMEFPLSHPIDDLVWIRGRDGRWNYFLSKFEVLCYAQNSLLFSIPKGNFSRIALLTSDHISDQSSLPSTTIVMVFVYREENGVTYARRGDSGLIIKADHPRFTGGLKQRMLNRRNSMLSAGATNTSKIGHSLHENKYGAIVGEWSSRQQAWCID